MGITWDYWQRSSISTTHGRGLAQPKNHNASGLSRPRRIPVEASTHPALLKVIPHPASATAQPLSPQETNRLYAGRLWAWNSRRGNKLPCPAPAQEERVSKRHHTFGYRFAGLSTLWYESHDVDWSQAPESWLLRMVVLLTHLRVAIVSTFKDIALGAKSS